MNWLIALLAFSLASPQLATGRQAPGPYRIGGVVVDADTGEPVARATVDIVAGGGEGSEAADQDGRFLFERLRPGKYSLMASAPGYGSLFYDQHAGLATAIVVGPGLDTEHIVFRLAREAVIYGTVTDERGAAVRGANVILIKEGTFGTRRASQRGWSQTNDLGQYRFPYLQPGKYYVVVAARPWYAETGFEYPAETGSPGFGSFGVGPSFNDRPVNPILDVVYPITFYPSVTDPAAASELNLTAGAEDEADIQLTAVPAVHVLVTGLPEEVSNRRVSYLSITASQSVFGTSVRLPSDPQDREVSPGEWEVAGLPPGPVTLTFAGYGMRWSHGTITVKPTEGETIDASSALAPILVSGVVIQPAGLTAPRNMQVQFNNQQGQTFPLPVQKGGTFSQMLDPGTYGVRVAGGLEYLRGLSATGARVNGHTVTIPASGNVNLTLTIGRGVGVVNGIAKLAGKPAPGVLVLLVPVSGRDVAENSRRDQSDSDGSFTLSNAIPGRYTLVAIANGWEIDWADPAVLKPYLAKGQLLDIAPGQTQTVTASVQPLLKSP